MPDAAPAQVAANPAGDRALRLIRLVRVAFEKHGIPGFDGPGLLGEVADFLDLVSLEARKDAGLKPIKPISPDNPGYAGGLIQRGMDLLRQLQTEGYNDAEQMAVLAYAEAGTRTIWGSQIRKAGAKRPGSSA